MPDGKLVASELSEETICLHLRLVPDMLSPGEKALIKSMKSAAIEYVCDHCAIDAKEVDEHEDLAIAVLVLIADMFDNRSVYVDKTNPNRTVDAILSHHDRNFIGNLDGE